MKKIFKDLVVIRKRDYILAFTDAFLIVGFVVLFTDTLWILASGFRFGWDYPDSVLQLVFAGGRNVAGLVLCYMLIGSYFKQGIIKFSRWTWNFLLINSLFLVFWFWSSPSPAFTDWTFAMRHNYSVSVVLLSLFVSHVIGKILVAVIFLTLWRSKQKHKQDDRPEKQTSEEAK